MRSATDWIRFFKSAEAYSFLRRFYGTDPALLTERRDAYLILLNEFARHYDAEARAVLARAPGRINLMGRHVDHRGGNVNPIALNLEILVAAGPRMDDRIIARNVESGDFPPRSFSISEEAPTEVLPDTDAWDHWTLARFKERHTAGASKDWVNYLKASAVYFQNQARTIGRKHPLRGMNLIVAGNVPRSAGLGSSSALFIGFTELLLYLNDLRFADECLVEHCGWGEWYVGTRGGMGDHAAIKLGRAGMISHIGFWPFSISHLPFPSGYQVVIANSKEEAHKAGNARDRFNQCVACYEFGLMLLRERFPELAPRMQRLRDIHSENLAMTDAEIRLMLLELPEKASRSQLHAMLPQSLHSRLQEIFAQHSDPDKGYSIRDVCIFGVAECERSRRCFEILTRGEVRAFGELMRISHHGDRIAAPAIWSKIQDEFPSDPARNHMPLHCQPGAYACSTPQIDEMVDIAMNVDGVLGAQISGAGLGGCIMALARSEAVEELRRALSTRYYQPRQLAPEVYACAPVAGSSVIE